MIALCNLFLQRKKKKGRKSTVKCVINSQLRKTSLLTVQKILIHMRIHSYQKKRGVKKPILLILSDFKRLI